jgi:glutamyl-tRNA synthetase
MTVRVRFAPSPTGYLHIGGARTALFNWLFARKQGGKFILRIEDTDQTRTVPGALEAIMDGLRWLGLDWDEGPDLGGPYGPYVQTERADLYREWADWLLGHGHAYKCFCTPEELEAMRREQMEKKLPLGYDGRCRHLTPAQIAAHEDAGREPVIRFKMPEEGETTIQDAIRGEITYDNKQIIDAVLLKSDGLPTYHLANVVDDHFMEITHIMRADEWINTAPLHIHLYQAFGWQIPVYAHLSLVMNPSGKGKLSKRTQAFDDEGQQVLVKVEEFQEAGYLPQAVVNFLANVGYATGDDREKYDVEEAIDQFKLENINPAPSRLPYSKLDWLNGQYIQELSPEALAQAILPFLRKEGYEADVNTLLPVAPAMRTRLKRLPEAIDFLRFIFERKPLVPDVEKLTHKKLPREAAEAAFRAARDFVADADSYDLDSISSEMMAIGARHTSNEKAGPFLGRMRYAVTRQRVSPPLFESMLALGREETLARLDEALALFEA